MPAHYDDARNRILGEVQAIRDEVGRLRDLKHARDIRARLAELHVWTTSDLVTIVDALHAEVRARILRDLGISAWEEAETPDDPDARPPVVSGVGISEPARMAAPVQPPASEEAKPLTHRELETLEDWTREKIAAADRAGVGAYPTDTQTLRLIAEVRRLRSALDPSRATMSQRAAFERIQDRFEGVPNTALDDLAGQCCPHRGPLSHLTDGGRQNPGAKCDAIGCPCSGWDGKP